MKKHKKILIIIAVIIVMPVILLTGAVVYINTAYSYIYDDMRIMGVVSDLLDGFDDAESLKDLSENTPSMPIVLSDDISI